jgi:glycosyltransferase involved in cell wall biosynthesis
LDHVISDQAISGRMRIATMLWHIAGRMHHLEEAEQSAETTTISLVTPCLNAASTIERTLESIADQNYPRLQYIVCDGGSTDGTLEILRRYEGIIDILIVEQDKNVAEALNKGFARATGDIRGYLNADDCLTPDALRKVAALFGRSADIDVVTGSCQRWYEDGTGVVTKVPDRYLRVIALRNDIEQPSTFWRASIQEKAGPFDDNLGLAFDWEYWNRLKIVGARFHRTDKLLSIYHFSKTNLTSRAGFLAIKEMYEVTRRYAGLAIADAYMTLFEEFDIKGFLDAPPEDMPPNERAAFEAKMDIYRTSFGSDVVENYNWNWASKQIRGVKWY